MTDRYQDMLNRGYEPGKTYYSTSPLCHCGRKTEYVVRTLSSQLEHLCVEHYRVWQNARVVR